MHKKITLKKLTLFGEALFWILLFRIGMFIIPFRFMIPFLNKPGKEKKGNDQLQLVEIKWVLQAVERKFPQVTNCWSLSAAGMILLKKRGIPSELYFGVLKLPTGEMKAHAWLKQGDLVVSGGKNHRRYAVVTIIRWGEVLKKLPKQFRQKNGILIMNSDELA